MLAAPGAGALSLTRDLLGLPAVRAMAANGGVLLQTNWAHLSRLGTGGVLAGLVVGLVGGTDADPRQAQAQSAEDVAYVYDALGRLRAVIDPARDAATYSYDPVGTLLSIGRQSAALTSVIEITPRSGSTGSTVTIEGTGFSSTPSQNAVTFGGVAANVTAATTTRLETVIPTGAATGPVAVTAPSGSATSATPFTVVAAVAAPAITGFSPNGGRADALVSVTGSNFDPVAPNNRVTLNGTHVRVESATSSSLTFKVPPSIGSGRITVSTQEGKATSTTDFIVPPAHYTPSDVAFSGRVAIGDSITVNVGTANKIGLVMFEGMAGQRVSVTLRDGTFTGLGNGVAFAIHDPQGAAVGGNSTGQSSGFLETRILPTTGTYTFVVDPLASHTGSITARIHSVRDVAGTIAPDGPSVTVTTTTPGQVARLSFSAAAGQQVSVDLSGGTFATGVSIAIQDPQGGWVGSSVTVQSSGTLGPRTLATTGTYNLVLDPNGTSTGSIMASLRTVVAFLLPPTLAPDSDAPVVASAGAEPGDGSARPADPADPTFAKVFAELGGLLADPPTGSPDDESWIPTEQHRRGDWRSGLPEVSRAPPPLVQEPRALSSDGVGLQVHGEPVVAVAITPPQGRTAPAGAAGGSWSGMLTGPGGEPRAKLELEPDTGADLRGTPGAMALRGRVLGPDGTPLGRVRLRVEADDANNRTATATDTVVSVAYEGQAVRTVSVRLGDASAGGIQSAGPRDPRGAPAASLPAASPSSPGRPTVNLRQPDRPSASP